MTWRRAVVTFLIGLLGAGLGVLLMFAAQHLYQDHLNLHALVQLEAQRQQAAAKPPSP